MSVRLRKESIRPEVTCRGVQCQIGAPSGAVCARSYASNGGESGSAARRPTQVAPQMNGGHFARRHRTRLIGAQEKRMGAQAPIILYDSAPAHPLCMTKTPAQAGGPLRRAARTTTQTGGWDWHRRRKLAPFPSAPKQFQKQAFWRRPKAKDFRLSKQPPQPPPEIPNRNDAPGHSSCRAKPHHAPAPAPG